MDQINSIRGSDTTIVDDLWLQSDKVCTADKGYMKDDEGGIGGEKIYGARGSCGA